MFSFCVWVQEFDCQSHGEEIEYDAPSMTLLYCNELFHWCEVGRKTGRLSSVTITDGWRTLEVAASHLLHKMEVPKSSLLLCELLGTDSRA